MPATKEIICVDLDGTLTPCDTLWESCIRLIRHNPFIFFTTLFSLSQGRAKFKSQIASLMPLSTSSLLWNLELVEWLQKKKASGHRLVLVTAADKTYAETVALKFNIFDEVYGSDCGINLKGAKKAELLQSKFGRKGFTYAGNSHDDIPVWQAAENAIIVNASPSVKLAAQKAGNVIEVFNGPPRGIKNWIKALRIHQWTKNTLVFIPFLAAHHFSDIYSWKNAFLAFLSFGLCASSVYVLNDLSDLESDRHHHRKRFRPFASASISLPHGIAAIPILLCFSFLIASCVNPGFILILSAYYILTSIYSFKLKNIPLVDVLILATLYMIRIIAGGLATALPVSLWLYTFSIFIFLSLGLLKRYVELKDIRRRKLTRAIGRGYLADDLEAVSSMGISSGYISVFVLILYVRSEEVKEFYQQPVILLGTGLVVLFWISRAWLLAHRSQLHDDPVIFALKDRASQITLLTMIFLFILATIC